MNPDSANLLAQVIVLCNPRGAFEILGAFGARHDQSRHTIPRNIEQNCPLLPQCSQGTLLETDHFYCFIELAMCLPTKTQDKDIKSKDLVIDKSSLK